jgi:two-component system chemotaxis response regulator CheB
MGARAQHGRDIVVVGASAGGVETLRDLVRQLPSDLPAAVFVVLHVPAEGTSVLPGILSRAGPLPATRAVDGQPLAHGTITVAPPNHHLLLDADGVRVVRGPRENGHRPAIDPLFRTAARVFRDRVAGVILSGSLDDGTAGLRTVKICGGTTIVQDPDEAYYPSMPRNAIAGVGPDEVLPIAAIASRLAELARALTRPTHRPEEESEPVDHELAYARDDPQPGRRSAFACPECGCALWEVDAGDFVQFRCRVGHAFTDRSLLTLQGDQLETALWTALRALEERASLNRRIARRLTGRDGANRATRHRDLAADADDNAAVVRGLLETFEAAATPDPASEPDRAAG